MAEPTTNTLIRVSDPEAIEMVGRMANDDLRSMGSEVAWLIRQEYARRQADRRYQPSFPVSTPEA